MDFRTIGLGLLVWGTLVWVVYFILKYAGSPVAVLDFLPYHLIGVIPGSLLYRWESWRAWARKLRGRA